MRALPALSATSPTVCVRHRAADGTAAAGRAAGGAGAAAIELLEGAGSCPSRVRCGIRVRTEFTDQVSHVSYPCSRCEDGDEVRDRGFNGWEHRRELKNSCVEARSGI